MQPLNLSTTSESNSIGFERKVDSDMPAEMRVYFFVLKYSTIAINIYIFAIIYRCIVNE